VKKLNRTLQAAILVALAPTAATAAEETSSRILEEIIVTATKRDTAIQDLPFSINAQTQEDLERLGAVGIEDLSRNVAGLNIQSLGPGQSQVAVRGVSAGQIVRDQPGVKEQVGVYLDETVVSLSLFTPDLDLFDLNRVETLRGPQGTLFGSGSIGGTVRYITNAPDPDAFEGAFEANMHTVTDGEEGGHIKGAVNLPFADGKAALRIVGYHTEYAGFIDALQEGGGVKDDVNGGTRTGGRIALTFQPTDNLSITPRLVYQEVEADGFNRQEEFNLFANPFTTTRPAVTFKERQQFLLLDEQFRDETLIGDLVVRWGLGAVDLTYAGSYLERDILVSRDASALTGSVSVDLGYPDAGVLLPSNLRDTTDLEQVTHELRLASATEGRWQWVAGAFMSSIERKYAQRLPTPGYDFYTDLVLGAGTSAAVANGYGPDSPFNSDLPYDIDQLALFGELNVAVTDRFDLTLGGRYYDFEEKRTISSGGLFANGDSGRVDKTQSDGFTPRLMASYEISDSVTVNGQVSQGFRLGGVNDPLNPALCTDEDREIFGGFQDYSDEKLWNYEIGTKARFGRVTLNAAAFYADIEDLQVTLDAGSCSSRISFNVPSAHSAGIEFELAAEPMDGLYLSFAGTVVEAEFDSTVRDANGNVLRGIQKGNRLASVPELQLAATATYTFGVDAFGAQEAYVTGSFQHVGDRITQPSDQVAGAGNFVSGLPFGGASGNDVTSLDLELDAYELLNLSTGLKWETWEAVLYVNNVTDENALLSFDRERGGRARLGFHTNQPRTVGLTLRAKF
jgi:outer membrane receptor protein involved in Fe transport